MASDAIDTAVLSHLSGDSTLSALLTGGVHFDALMTEGPEPPTSPYATVMVFSGKDVREFGDRTWEEHRYLITVHGGAEAITVPLSTLRQAYARIDELLEGSIFPISGYTLIKSERERRYVGLFLFDEFKEYEEFYFLFLAPFGGLYAIRAQAN